MNNYVIAMLRVSSLLCGLFVFIGCSGVMHRGIDDLRDMDSVIYLAGIVGDGMSTCGRGEVGGIPDVGVMGEVAVFEHLRPSEPIYEVGVGRVRGKVDKGLQEAPKWTYLTDTVTKWEVCTCIVEGADICLGKMDSVYWEVYDLGLEMGFIDQRLGDLEGSVDRVGGGVKRRGELFLFTIGFLVLLNISGLIVYCSRGNKGGRKRIKVVE
jgi:hypothetical protein